MIHDGKTESVSNSPIVALNPFGGACGEPVEPLMAGRDLPVDLLFSIFDYANSHFRFSASPLLPLSPSPSLSNPPSPSVVHPP